MNEVLRQKLDKIAVANGWDSNDDWVIFEILTESKSVKEYDHDEHRWYTAYSRVVQVSDFFVDFADMTSTGDEPGYDSDDRQKDVLRTAVEVFEKQVTITDYVTKDKL